VVARTGERQAVSLSNELARRVAKKWAVEFGVGPDRPHTFEKASAKADLDGGKKKGSKKKG
jgi:hypothetical protein